MRALPSHRPWRWRFRLLLAALLTLLLVLAALRPLSVPDEARYSDISRWMLVSGDWLVPRLNGLPFLHKPPLTHWEQAASMALFGVTPWAARIPQILLALLLVGGLYGAARRLAGVALARRAALMLALSASVLVGGQFANHDIGVAAWIASAIWCFALAFAHGERPHAGWALAGFGACALGLLTKGLIGLALPGLVLALWLTWTHQWRKAWRLPWVSGVALFALIAVPWFVLVARRYPGLWSYLFGEQQFTRYVGGGFNNEQPWWFYLAAVVLLLLPWSLFALLEAFVQARSRRAPLVQDGTRWVSLCWIWLGAIVLFFSIPRSKLIGYILPALPPMALLAALGWQRTVGARPHASRWFAALALLPLALALRFTLSFPGMQRAKLAEGVAAELACRARPGDTILVIGGYPMDLPFVARTQTPLVVVQDWPQLRISEGDTWRRELLDAGGFEPELADRILRPPAVLQEAAREPGHWLLAPSHAASDQAIPPPGWRQVFEGPAWRLYQSSATQSPVAPGHEGLPGCQRHAPD